MAGTVGNGVTSGEGGDGLGGEGDDWGVPPLLPPLPELPPPNEDPL